MGTDWLIDERFRAAGRLLGYEENFLVLLDNERRYRAARATWKQFNSWKRNRNPARAAMDAEFGYDGKHALHLVRLLRMCREILTEGRVDVRRPDAGELLGLVRGEWSYDKLMAWADEQDRELVELARHSDLPQRPDHEALDALCQEIVRCFD